MMTTLTRDPLSIRGLTKEFAAPEGATFRALDGIDLDIVPGEFFVMLGPSGCGKTTLLRAIAGLEQPTAGEIWLGETRIDGLPPYRRRVNTVFQSYALFPHLTVRQNVAFGLEMEGRSPRSPDVRARVDEMLDLVRLTSVANRKPGQLSGGQQQRVALARSLAKQPEVLLLDEPLSALDLKLRRSMQTELKRIQVESGVTFVFVTHDQEEAMSMGDRIAVFDQGKIAQLGEPRDLYERPASRFVAAFIGEMNFVDAVAGPGGIRTSGGVSLPADALSQDTPPVGEHLLLGVRPEHFRVAADGAFAGRLVACEFLGADVRLCVQVGPDERVWARVSASYDGPTRPGSSISLAPQPGRVKVVPK